MTELIKQRLKEELNACPLTKAEIAARVGVEDPFYFNRLFRRFYGMAPREYRKKIRGEKE